MTVVLIVAGLVGLFVGGDLLVRGAVALATRLGVSPLVIGLTLVGFGTSTPELITSVQAALQGVTGIAIGNVVGSNIANVLLILGTAALIAPIRIDRAPFRRDAMALTLATALAVGLVLTGEVGRAEGGILVFGLVLYLAMMLRSAGQEGGPTNEDVLRAESAVSKSKAIAMLVGGLVILLLAAPALVSGAVSVAEWAGVSDTLIGLTIVAVGTSLPELVTAVIAARRGETAVAYGNIIGSNIFNILGILGIAGMIVPLPVPAEIIALDLWIMAGTTVIALAMAITGWRITRAEGGVLLALYLAYLALLIATA